MAGYLSPRRLSYGDVDTFAWSSQEPFSKVIGSSGLWHTQPWQEDLRACSTTSWTGCSSQAFLHSPLRDVDENWHTSQVQATVPWQPTSLGTCSLQPEERDFQIAEESCRILAEASTAAAVDDALQILQQAELEICGGLQRKQINGDDGQLHMRIRELQEEVERNVRKFQEAEARIQQLTSAHRAELTRIKMQLDSDQNASHTKCIRKEQEMALQTERCAEVENRIQQVASELRNTRARTDEEREQLFVENEALVDARQELEEQIAEKNALYDSQLKSERQILELKADFESAAMTHHDEAVRLRRALQEEKRKNSALQRNVDKQLSQIELSMKQDQNSMQAKVASFKTNEASQNQRILDLEQAFGDERRTFQLLQAENKTLETEIDVSARRGKLDQEAMQAMMCTEIKEVTFEREQLYSQLRVLRMESLEDMSRIKEKHRAHLQEKERNFEAGVGELHQRLIHSLATQDELKVTISEMQDAGEEYEKTLQIMNVQQSHLSSSKQRILLESADLRAQLTDVTTERDQLALETEGVRTKLQNALVECDQLSANISQLKNAPPRQSLLLEADSLRLKLKEVMMERDKLTVDNAELSSAPRARPSLVAEAANLRFKLDEVVLERDKLADDAALHGSILDTFARDEESLRSQLKDALARRDLSTNEAQSALAECSQLTASMESTTFEQEKLVGDNSSLRSQLKDALLDRDMLKHDLHKHKEAARSRRSVADLQLGSEALRTQLKQALSERDRWKQEAENVQLKDAAHAQRRLAFESDRLRSELGQVEATEEEHLQIISNLRKNLLDEQNAVQLLREEEQPLKELRLQLDATVRQRNLLAEDVKNLKKAGEEHEMTMSMLRQNLDEKQHAAKVLQVEVQASKDSKTLLENELMSLRLQLGSSSFERKQDNAEAAVRHRRSAPATHSGRLRQLSQLRRETDILQALQASQDEPGRAIKQQVDVDLTVEDDSAYWDQPLDRSVSLAKHPTSTMRLDPSRYGSLSESAVKDSLIFSMEEDTPISDGVVSSFPSSISSPSNRTGVPKRMHSGLSPNTTILFADLTEEIASTTLAASAGITEGSASTMLVASAGIIEGGASTTLAASAGIFEGCASTSLAASAGIFEGCASTSLAASSDFSLSQQDTDRKVSFTNLLGDLQDMDFAAPSSDTNPSLWSSVRAAANKRVISS